MTILDIIWFFLVIRGKWALLGGVGFPKETPPLECFFLHIYFWGICGSSRSKIMNGLLNHFFFFFFFFFEF